MTSQWRRATRSQRERFWLGLPCRTAELLLTSGGKAQMCGNSPPRCPIIGLSAIGRSLKTSVLLSVLSARDPLKAHKMVFQRQPLGGLRACRGRPWRIAQLLLSERFKLLGACAAFALDQCLSEATAAERDVSAD